VKDRSAHELLAAARAGDRAALARLITLAESEPELALDGLAGTGAAQVVGLTGAPGVGKSSLVDRLCAELCRSGKTRPAVLGVDPTSPFTGGAVLGDRVRISEETLAAGVFVRSMASRGSSGGLSRAVGAAARVLSACGHSPVVVETVGAGQGEVAVGELADTVVVVLVPGMGDDIQMLKMGILEIADVYAVNKADLGGAETYAEFLRDALTGSGLPCRARRELAGAADWTAPVVATSARTGLGVGELAAAIEAHRAHLAEGGRGAALRAARAARRIMRALAEKLAERAVCDGKCKAQLGRLAAAVAAGELSEWQAAEKLVPKAPPRRRKGPER
jgi:LAO/AO transport system kinase